MDELINFVSQKTGLSPDMARGAAEAVLGFVKDKLPENLRPMVDNLIGGNAAAGGGGGDIAGQAMGALGGMFGGGDNN